MKTRILKSLLGIFLVLFAMSGSAQTVSWNNPSGGLWDEPSNWNPNSIPTASDTVLITLPGTYTVRLGGSGTARCLTVGAESGTQTLSVTPTWYNGVHLTVGGRLTGLATSRIIIDVGNGGSLEVDSTLTNAGTLTVTNSFTTGYAGSIQVKDGWLVNEGTINIVQGTGGGRNLDASLDNRGVVNIDFPLTLMKNSPTHINTGIINVRSNLSVLPGSTIATFTNGGTIAVDSGRTVLFQQGRFVHNQGTMTGKGLIQIDNVKATLLSDFSIGTPSLQLTYTAVRGPGTLVVPEGSALSLVADSIFCPLDVAGYLYNSPSAFSGSTTCILGRLTTHSSSRIAADAVNQCMLIIDSTFTNEGTLTVYTSYDWYVGSIVVRNGWLINTGTINFPAGGSPSVRPLDASLDNRGVVNIDVPLTLMKDSPTHVNAGTINVRGNLTVLPGSANATFTNRGTISLNYGKAFVITAGTLENTSTGLLNIGIGGRVPNVDLAQIRVNGGVIMAGTLNILLAETFLPEIDDSLELVTGYSRSGTFHSIRIPTLNGNPLLVSGYGATNVHVKAYIDFANIRELAIGQPLPDSLRPAFYRFYRVYLPQGVSPLIRVGSVAPLLAPQLFVAKGIFPSRSHFDSRSTTELPQSGEVIMASADSGMYYVLAHNPEATLARYTVRVDTLGYMVRRIRIPASGNSGEVTVEILGAKLQEGARGYLGRVGEESIPDTANFLVDPTQLNSRFALSHLAQGDWDITVVNPDSTRALLPHAITVSQNTAPQLDVTLTGPAQVRRGMTGTYLLSATNPSNTNVERALLFLEARPEIEITAGLDSFPIDSLLDDRTLTTWVDSTGMRLFCLSYCNIAPGRTKSVELTIRPTVYGNYRFYGELYTYSRRQYDSLVLDARKKAVALGLVDTSSFHPVGAEAGSIQAAHGGIRTWPLDEGEDFYAEINGERNRVADGSRDVAGVVRDAFTTLYFPLKKPGPGKIIGLAALFGKMKGLVDRHVRPRFPLPGTESVQSVDPNDIFVPMGNGALNWVQARPLPYRIEFENLADSATAPARYVRVFYRLDPSLEPGSLSLGAFGFRNMDFITPPGRSQHQTRIDLKDSLGMYVDVAASLEGDSLVWTFETIDPSTGWPVTDPMKGFLAINDSTGKGTGYVTFAISPKTQAATGTRINAQAMIFFDNNSPISTPTKFNTYDGSAPVSHVGPLDDSSATRFDVRWSGSDAGGIASYTVYASSNGIDFQPWISNIADTTGRFSGALGSTYGFYSVAVDTAGNIERSKLIAEASTRVVTGMEGSPGLPLTHTLFQNYPNPFNLSSTIRISLPVMSHVTLTVYNILGQRVRTLVDEKLTAGYHNIRFDATSLASGVYFYHVQAGSFVSTRKMLLMK